MTEPNEPERDQGNWYRPPPGPSFAHYGPDDYDGRPPPGPAFPPPEQPGGPPPGPALYQQPDSQPPGYGAPPPGPWLNQPMAPASALGPAPDLRESLPRRVLRRLRGR
jgi:hypothetical protein